MGDWYEVKELAGVFYIEYCNENTGWNTIALELTDRQCLEVEAFTEKQAENRSEFLKGVIDLIKTPALDDRDR